MPASHRDHLLGQRRCVWCAEPVGVAVLLRGAACPHCGHTLGRREGADLEAMLEPIEGKWRRRRWWLYGVLAVGTFATGALPFVATLLTAIFFVAMRFVLIREPVMWFGPARRLASRFTLRMWLLTTIIVTMAANELLTFVPVASMPLKMVASVAGAMFFVEGSLWFLRGRLRREASATPSLQWWEWLLPVSLVGTVAALGGAAALALHEAYQYVNQFFQ